jgi:hypothetical protein
MLHARNVRVVAHGLGNVLAKITLGVILLSFINLMTETRGARQDKWINNIFGDYCQRAIHNGVANNLRKIITRDGLLKT